ncbi:uncharacterized protein LOC115223993 isoform X2 [Octopus sinensis]|uniref:Uncharacterized protein LOC115223993 isoform X2 n=1 Tax=Octopus sinensis TaxID=2607531 RepID=A0A7E6FLS4_9MOLL|nr:uncharacterized protein LOC115223993 isoform X2 [Octopus sinensis]
MDWSDLERGDIVPIDEEVFDFDIESDSDEEIFFGDVGFTEKCVAHEIDSICNAEPLPELTSEQWKEMEKEAYKVVAAIRENQGNCNSPLTKVPSIDTPSLSQSTGLKRKLQSLNENSIKQSPLLDITNYSNTRLNKSSVLIYSNSKFDENVLDSSIFKMNSSCDEHLGLVKPVCLNFDDVEPSPKKIRCFNAFMSPGKDVPLLINETCEGLYMNSPTAKDTVPFDFKLNEADLENSIKTTRHKSRHLNQGRSVNKRTPVKVKEPRTPESFTKMSSSTPVDEVKRSRNSILNVSFTVDRDESFLKKLEDSDLLKNTKTSLPRPFIVDSEKPLLNKSFTVDCKKPQLNESFTVKNMTPPLNKSFTVRNQMPRLNESFTVKNQTLPLNESFTVKNQTLPLNESSAVKNQTPPLNESFTVKNQTLPLNESFTVKNQTLPLNESFTVKNQTLPLNESFTVKNQTPPLNESSTIKNKTPVLNTSFTVKSEHSLPSKSITLGGNETISSEPLTKGRKSNIRKSSQAANMMGPMTRVSTSKSSTKIKGNSISDQQNLHDKSISKSTNNPGKNPVRTVPTTTSRKRPLDSSRQSLRYSKVDTKTKSDQKSLVLENNVTSKLTQAVPSKPSYLVRKPDMSFNKSLNIPKDENGMVKFQEKSSGVVKKTKSSLQLPHSRVLKKPANDSTTSTATENSSSSNIKRKCLMSTPVLSCKSTSKIPTSGSKEVVKSKMTQPFKIQQPLMALNASKPNVSNQVAQKGPVKAIHKPVVKASEKIPAPSLSTRSKLPKPAFTSRIPQMK